MRGHHRYPRLPGRHAGFQQDDVPSTFVEGNYSPEVARYVQSIAGVALASGIQ